MNITDSNLILKEYYSIKERNPDEYNSWKDFEGKDIVIHRALFEAIGYIQKEMEDNLIDVDDKNLSLVVNDLIDQIIKFKENGFDF